MLPNRDNIHTHALMGLNVYNERQHTKDTRAYIHITCFSTKSVSFPKLNGINPKYPVYQVYIRRWCIIYFVIRYTYYNESSSVRNGVEEARIRSYKRDDIYVWK